MTKDKATDKSVKAPKDEVKAKKSSSKETLLNANTDTKAKGKGEKESNAKSVDSVSATLKKPAKVEVRKTTANKSGSAANYHYGRGARKNAVARVFLKPGTGKIIVNKLDVSEYFKRGTHVHHVLMPFVATKTTGQFDILSTVKGGGHTGQAGAIRLGIARALDKIDSSLHAILRKEGFLTRDARVVERKKYGKHKARRSTQFSKR